MWHLSISNCCCLLFILFYLKLFHSYTSVWSNIILVNILVNILIVLLVVYILYYYYFTINFSKTHLFCDNFAFVTLLVDCSCSLTWSIHILARFIYYARFVAVITYILTIFCIIMKNSLFLRHLSISNCCCLLFILFYLKLIHSYTSVWSKNNLVNILVHILIVLLVVYILYYRFTVYFSKSFFFCDNFAFLTLLVDCFCSPTWFIYILARFIYYARFVVVITYILTIFCIIMKFSLFLRHLSISNCCCLLFILFYLKLIYSYTSFLI